MRSIRSRDSLREARADRASPSATTPSGPVIEAVVRELRGALRELRCATSERIIRQGISMTQFHVLWLLEHHGELPMGRLAELLAVSLSNSSGLIDRMEERGLVERRRVRDDRRLVVVAIGPEGLRLVRELEAVHHDRFGRALASVEPARLANMLKAFADFRAAIEEDAGADNHRHATDPTAGPTRVDPAASRSPTASAT